MTAVIIGETDSLSSTSLPAAPSMLTTGGTGIGLAVLAAGLTVGLTAGLTVTVGVIVELRVGLTVGNIVGLTVGLKLGEIVGLVVDWHAIVQFLWYPSKPPAVEASS